ncbi:aspartyl-tRNA(Asn)/glutamyl-tRNA(Gln) amidotransferase subunit C [Lachnospiraceae bacterium PF1-21]|uniref:Asp-tRNA(Asn)/Glu-tRNA(Gln) amidotransferase subunit GatC n=1 Tax=Ohessyouella blattaphilus TaxID=2949333 RepID=UPI0025644947|nr:Asp-tRNA(Asn)/Glu-tRNA(Gln) amidotransferase subunit GatC [Lachnospiraceae bacterium OttesenSCG-928-J05]
MKITDETIAHVSLLAQLELGEEEKKKAAAEMEKMLTYIETLETLDTEAVEPLTHLFASDNVFREDVPSGANGAEAALKNAPLVKDGMFKVPKTIG